MCFLMFSDADIISDFRYLGRSHFTRMTRARLPRETIWRLRLSKWRFEPAPTQSDVIWSALDADVDCSNLKSFFLLCILFVIAVLLISPILLAEVLTTWVHSLNLTYNLVNSMTVDRYITTFSAMIVNVMIIPFLIDMMVLLEDIKTKSQR